MEIFGASGILAVAIPFLVQQIKKIKFIGSANAPALTFVLGIIGGIATLKLGMMVEGTTLMQAILIGVAIGGTSTGLYDLTKNTLAPTA